MIVVLRPVGGTLRNFHLSLTLVITTVFAQSAPATAHQTLTATLVHAEGEVYLNDRPIDSNAGAVVLPDVAAVRTNLGRAAIALGRSGVLFLDARTSVRLPRHDGSNLNRIEILAGSATIASGTSPPRVACENEVTLSDGGWFRFDVQRVNSADEGQCQFRVFEGVASVRLASVTSALRVGEAIKCNRRCGDMIPTTEFARDQFDDFDQWARRIHERLAR